MALCINVDSVLAPSKQRAEQLMEDEVNGIDSDTLTLANVPKVRSITIQHHL
jgi:hypothetical protein